MYTGSEKRRYKRIKQQFIVKMREKCDYGENLSDPGWSMITTKNLGAGGVLLNHNRKPEIGSLMEFRINFPRIAKPINCIGKVNRIEEDPHSPIIRFATVFTEITEAAQKSINSMAEEFGLRKPERID